MSASVSNTSDPCGLLEKYFHSQGAALYDEGRLDEAIEFFRKAVGLDDQPFTHYHLSLAHLRKGEPKKARAEIDAAIALDPANPQYYYERSLMRRRAGDPAGASRDRMRAVGLDANYARIRKIRTAAHAIERFLACDERMVAWCRKRTPANRALARILRGFEWSSGDTCDALASASCVLPCPAYCCHFSGEMVRHGVHVGPWKLTAIRNFIKEEGLSGKDVLSRIPFEGAHLRRLIPPQFVIKEKGCEYVYFPRRTGRGLTKDLLKDLPKGRGYRELAWINKDAKACAFLKQGRCAVHDAGGEPSLPTCKEFLCFTGFLFLLLLRLGLISERTLQRRSMRELNRVAVEALLILARRVYADRDLLSVRAALHRALRAAVNADRTADEKAIDIVRTCALLQRQYGRQLLARYERAGKEIGTLLGRKHTVAHS